MPKALPRYCEKWRDRHGTLRIYARKGKGPRVALPSDPDSPEFTEAYLAFMRGTLPPKPGKASAAPGTIAALVTSYMRSAAYTRLRPTTRTGYATRIEVLRTQHGERTVAGMTRQRIEAKILAPYADRPGQMLALLKMLRVLVRHAIEIGWITSDPTAGIKRPKGGEVRAWTEAEIAAFKARWPMGSKEHLAFALMLYTGQRRSDVHRMTWADVEGSAIRVVQQKTGAKLTIALHRDLQAALAAAPREHMTIINTAFGRPFTVAGFSAFMRDAITEAGLPLSAQPHGLRKAAGRRLAEAGCTAHEIMAVLGHKTLAEAERYTREADQKRLASAAVTKLEGRKRNKRAQTTPERFGENGE